MTCHRRLVVEAALLTERLYARRAGLLQTEEESAEVVVKNGASEGIRTLDTHVGNVMLYQAELRSLPDRRALDYEAGSHLQALFYSE